MRFWEIKWYTERMNKKSQLKKDGMGTAVLREE
jgi:hypothetical protein